MKNVNYDELYVGQCGIDCTHFESKEEMDEYLVKTSDSNDLLFFIGLFAVALILIVVANKLHKI